MNLREWALPVYTILVQISVGTLLMLWIVREASMHKFTKAEFNRIVKFPLTIIFLTTCLAMIGSHFHLSRPLHSYLAVLNFRSSWLSREIVFTVLFFLALAAVWALYWFKIGTTVLKTVLGWSAILFGLVVVYCMASIYLLPSQPAWNSPFTILSFYLTTLLLGSIALPAMLLIDFSFSNVLVSEQLGQQHLLVKRVLLWSAATGFLIWLITSALNLYHVSTLRHGDQWAQTSYNLLTSLYYPLLIMRLSLPFLGIIILSISGFNAVKRNRAIRDLMFPVFAACICVMVGEILARFLFYATHVRIGV